MTTTEVAIVGRGAVAMTAALAMARKGRMVTLFSDAEAAPGWRRHFALGRRSVDFLRGLGVTPPMRAVFCFALYGGGRSLVLREKRPLCHVVAEADLWRALAERCAVRLCRSVVWEGCEGREAVFFGGWGAVGGGVVGGGGWGGVAVGGSVRRFWEDDGVRAVGDGGDGEFAGAGGGYGRAVV